MLRIRPKGMYEWDTVKYKLKRQDKMVSMPSCACENRFGEPIFVEFMA